jgi:hypothetical protein
MTSRIHHYVPQCYLRGFASDNKSPSLFVVDLISKQSFTTSPRNIAAERDFNRIELDGVAPDAVESAYSQFEAELAPALSRTIESRTLADGEDRELVLNLIGLLAIRNPRHRANFAGFQNRLFKTVLNLALSTKEVWESQVQRMRAAGYLAEDAPTDYEQIKAAVMLGDYSFVTPTNQHVAIELDALDAVLPPLFARKWTVFRTTAKDQGFITSDHPVCLTWADPDPKLVGRPIGFGLPNSLVLFPLSKEVALSGRFEGSEATVEADVFDVGSLNSTFADYAERQIYARDSHQQCFRGMEGFITVGQLHTKSAAL